MTKVDPDTKTHSPQSGDLEIALAVQLPITLLTCSAILAAISIFPIALQSSSIHIHAM
ncbi:hypothetical protein [Microbispora sp. NBC_01389]|uniref:hypothetical protein n=1 Tax=Microbispora sp. NBC_01389 TaxID=2903584 RepID=UPI0032486532